MEDRVDLKDARVGAREEHAPITNSETKATSMLQALDVTCSCFCVPFDVGDDALSRSLIKAPKVAECPRRE